jgi:hypothetical protein
MSDHPRDTRVKCPHFSLDFIDSAMCFGDRQLSRHVAMKIHNEADFSFPDTNIVDIPNDAALCSGRRQCFFNLTMLLFRCFLPIEPVCCHWLNVCVYLGILADSSRIAASSALAISCAERALISAATSRSRLIESFSSIRWIVSR